MEISFESLEVTLPLMFKGMFGIFVVTLLIFLLIKILLKAFPTKEN